MSMQTRMIPQNDAELNHLIQSMNRAYGKYFDAAIGSKRSEKLRDCICEGLGFTNGGYQQLQAYWSATGHSSFDWTDPNNVLELKCRLNGSVIAIMAKDFINGTLINWFQTHFPVDDKKLLDEDESNDLADPYSGWTLSTIKENSEAQVTYKSLEKNGRLTPLYFKGIVVGFTFTQHHGEWLNAILVSAMMSGDFDFQNSLYLSSAYAKYISDNERHVTEKLHPGKYLTLRMSSMKYGIMLPFESAEIKGDILEFFNAGKNQILTHNARNGMIEWNNLEFDFCTFCTVNMPVGKHLLDIVEHLGKNKPKITHQWKEFIEWFPGDRIEMRDDDADGDEIFDLKLDKTSTYTIK